MKKKFTGRALPIVLSVVLTGSSAAVPAYTGETVYAAEEAAEAAEFAVDGEAAESSAGESMQETDVPAESMPAESAPEESLPDNAAVPEENSAEQIQTDEQTEEDSSDAEEDTEDLTVEEEATETVEAAEPIAMSSVTIGGITYFYVNTASDVEEQVYTASVTTGRGASAVTTVTEYKKTEMTPIGDTGYYYTAAPGAEALSGTLYGYSKTAENDGQETSYSAVYSSLGALASDPAYDAVSSATGISSYHSKDIPSVVTVSGGQITGLKLGKGLKTADAAAYVEATILNAAGETLTSEQQDLLDIKLKNNPMDAPATALGTVTAAAASASYTTSKFGNAEFDIIPDDTLTGFVWSEYWDSVYAATISDGSTTVGAVHWIDMYGEAATSGYHYNKIQIALNNGTSVASNGAEVSRYAAFYDSITGRIKGGSYTITIYADGYTPMTATIEVPTETMKSVTVGDVTYFYANIAEDSELTVYQASITSGRGESAVTTVYNYNQADLTPIEGTGLAYVAANGSTPLEGTLYGYGEGTATNYKTVYSNLGLSTEDPAYDTVSSATGLTGNHAKDISSVVVKSNGTITGLTLQREVKEIDAKAYVEAKIVDADADTETTDAQKELLKITLKKNPSSAPSAETITVAAASASYAESKFGNAEFDIIPDDTLTGFVWSEYWDNVYAATVSNGKTTVGAVHWIDMYGEAATSGYHYNKIQIALNNGTSVASNGAEVSRYAAFYNKDGSIKGGTYTITIYSDGYTPMTASVTVEGTDDDEKTSPVTYKVTASVLNVRKGPGTKYSIIGGLKKGTDVEILETSSDGKWAEISMKGVPGWISTSYLCKNETSDTKDSSSKDSGTKDSSSKDDTSGNTSSTEEGKDQSAAATQTWKVFASALNIRKGAGTGYAKIGSLAYGTTVEVLETKNGWAKIAYNGSYGWIFSNYLGQVTSSTQEKTDRKTCTIIAGILNVRSGAGVNYSIVGNVKKGTEVTVYDTKNGWNKIAVNGTYGWVSTKYCK